MPRPDDPAAYLPAVRRRQTAEISARSLTQQHMASLHEFLRRRIDHLLTAHPVGSEEYRAAQALHLAVEWTWEELQDCVSFLDADREDKDALLGLGDCWSNLRGLTLPWTDAPDYDDTLWPPVKFEHLRFVPVQGSEAAPPHNDTPR
ncbi:hypothetical protein [Streptomyces sp. NPDC007369]|uniref:hypothetical protein n=1 Tax=Streptomyces sp. NPDC007369 TaxID=3154589 RepID=UPI0033FD02D7